jgi:hypothetical protein
MSDLMKDDQAIFALRRRVAQLDAELAAIEAVGYAQSADWAILRDWDNIVVELAATVPHTLQGLQIKVRVLSCVLGMRPGERDADSIAALVDAVARDASRPADLLPG